MRELPWRSRKTSTVSERAGDGTGDPKVTRASEWEGQVPSAAGVHFNRGGLDSQSGEL